MRNNFTVMHSALTSAYMVLVKAYMDHCQIPPAELARVISILEQAVDIKPRNCDMGTAEEQANRFHNFCVSNSGSIDGMCSSTCPCIASPDKCHCLCKWSQMPYKEGGVK